MDMIRFSLMTNMGGKMNRKSFYAPFPFGLFIFLLLVFTTTPAAWSATYYVHALLGNDTSAGTTSGAPFRTIQRAHDLAGPGDTIEVAAGEYGSRVYITRSGSSGQPILYRATGRTVTKGFTVTASFIHITGFEITNTEDHWADGAGIAVTGKSCEIRDNYIHDVTRVGINLVAAERDSPDTSNCIVSGNRIVRAGLAGIMILGRNHIIEANDISHSIQHPPKWINPPSWADADGIVFLGSGHIIRKNYIHDITTADAGNTAPHIDCFQTYGPAYNILIEQNYCDNPDDGMQGFMISSVNPPVRDLTIRNNVIKAFRIMNIWDCERPVIVQNTFRSRLDYKGESGYGIELHNSPAAKIRNNLFIDVGRHLYPYLGKAGSSANGLEAGNNSHFMTDGKPPAGSPYPGDIWQTDPKLVDLSSDDYRLRQDSPLIDKGTPLTEVTRDFSDTHRPQGAGYDIGAFEYNASSSGKPSPPHNVRIIP
jgi:hypothetical protein